MLSTRDALMGVYVSQEAFTRFSLILPTRVAVPGGLAFLTSSFERLNAPLKEVIMVAGVYLIKKQMRKIVAMMICDVDDTQHDVFMDMVLQSK
jgi:hypothetical protein